MTTKLTPREPRSPCADCPGWAYCHDPAAEHHRRAAVLDDWTRELAVLRAPYQRWRALQAAGRVAEQQRRALAKQQADAWLPAQEGAV